MQILSQIPFWVPVLFGVLLVLGLRARHRRHVPVAVIYSIPLLSLLSLRTVADLPAGEWIWAIFGACVILGLWAGGRMQAGWTLAREGRRVEVAGEPVTLILLMAVFGSNFANGIITSVQPNMLENIAFQIGLTSLLGVVSGVFLGRAAHVMRAGRDG